MLKGQKKHIDKEQGKTKPEAPRSVNYRTTQNKNKPANTQTKQFIYRLAKLWTRKKEKTKTKEKTNTYHGQQFYLADYKSS